MARGVLHHAALPHRGGAVRVARLLMEAQRSAGRASMLSYEIPENNPEDLAGSNAGSSPLHGPTAPGDLAALAEALAGPPLPHLHTSTDWPALFASLLDSGLGKGALLTLHDASALTGGCAYPLDCPCFPRCQAPCPRNFPAADDRQARTLELLARLAPVLVSPSRWLAGVAAQALPDLRARIIPNGVPWPEAAALAPRAQARALLNLPPDAPVALFAAHGGVQAAYKSGGQWLECWRMLCEALPPGLPEPRGFAVGGDTAETCGGLSVWPYVDRAKLALVMRAADLLIYPTLADNHPLVLLEAAANELPVASFSVGGVPEIVVHGETGLLVPPEAGLEGLCRAAAGLLARRAQARDMGRSARERGAKRFDARRMAGDYERLLERLEPGSG